MNNPDPSASVKTSITTAVKEPHLFKLIYVNDDKTAMEFVIETLVDIFNYTELTAEKITLEIHENGSAVVAVLPYELAEQKGVEVTVSARSKGFPLQVKLEPDV
jgi:ATP-dependent Clp protease adaptor protein ClpS|tara:strand:- start:301 stop:612 length:312 start_codon:yes stop_codon:yes gene_type:complete